MGDCQNYGPFLGPYYNTGPNTGPNLGDPKGTIILPIPHVESQNGNPKPYIPMYKPFISAVLTSSNLWNPAFS